MSADQQPYIQWEVTIKPHRDFACGAFSFVATPKPGASSPVRSSDSADRELPLQDSNLDYLIQSAGPRATQTDKLTGSGVPTSIGALSV